MTQTPLTDELVKELYEDAAKRKKAPVPVRDPFDRAIELCYELERQLAERDRQLAEAQRDAERFLWWFSKDRSSNGEIANLLLRQISGDSPTVIEWRNTIDQAIQEQKK